jgi:hypothetical protein
MYFKKKIIEREVTREFLKHFPLDELTTGNMAIALAGLKDGWLEDPEDSKEKNLWLEALESLIEDYEAASEE